MSPQLSVLMSKRRIQRDGRAAVFVLLLVAAVGAVGVWLVVDRQNEIGLTDHGDSKPAAEPVRRTRPPARDSSYAGSRICAQCHKELFDSFQRHPMGQSVVAAAQVEAAHLDESKLKFSPPGPRSYQVQTVDGRMEHSETWTDSSGQELYRQTVPVQFAIGSGRRGHSFVIDRGGVLYMSSLTWYSEGNRWDLSPGYNAARHPRFERQISDGCLACHVGRTNSVENEPHRFQPQPFAEPAIGCERCHGPGQAHVDRHLKNSGDPDRPDTIINPARLDPVRRESVCYQCHLHGIKRVPRYGRTEYDFRPGDELSDIWVTFVHGPQVHADGTTTAVSQVEQFTESRCFVESQGKMGCISCHDPHRSPKPEERVDFYRQRCLKCHSEPSTVCREPEPDRRKSVADDSCIDCHMPRLGASDVPHTSQSDHRILRRSGTSNHSDTSVSRQHADDNRIVFPHGGKPPQWEIERVEGLLLARIVEQSGDRQLAANALPALVNASRQAPDDVDVLDARVYLTALAGNTPEAMQIGEQALQVAPRRESILESLVLISEPLSTPEVGLRFVERQLEVNPWRSESHLRKARFLARLRQTENAIAAARQALTLNPLLHPARQLLVDLLRQSGQTAEAEAEEELFRKLNP